MRRTVTWVLYMIMGVQIAFGCVYFATNFFAVQQFAENCVLALPMWVVSFVQLLLAAVSTWYVLGKLGFGKSRKGLILRGYICAFLLTVPYLLQMHLAKLVWSLSLSCLLWMLGLIMDIAAQGASKKRVFLLAGAYFLYGIICPDGLWLGGILVLVGSLLLKKRDKTSRAMGELREAIEKAEPEIKTQWERAEKTEQEIKTQGEKTKRTDLETETKRKKIIRTDIVPDVRRCIPLAVLFTAIVIFATNLGLNSAFPKARRIYRENNLGTAVVSRFVWPNFASNYFFWDEEVKAVLSEEDAVRLCQRIDLLEEEFYPAMVEAYGTGKATKLCLEMGYRCLMDRSRETVSEIGRDLRDHLLIPFTIENNLQGRGVSMTAWNYGRMKARSPVLVKYYFRYGSFELPILLLGSLLLWWFHRNDQMGQWIKERAAGKETKPLAYRDSADRGNAVQWKLLCFTLFLYTLWYTMWSNLPIDYKLVLPILFVWYLASVGGLLCQKPEN